MTVRKAIELQLATTAGGPLLARPPEVSTCAPPSGGALIVQHYFAACAFTAAMSASLRSVITPIWLVR
jgi:hypothetical protein